MNAPSSTDPRRQARRALLAVLVTDALLGGAAVLPWLSGTGADVLAATSSQVSGLQLAPALVPCVLVIAIALLAVATSGPIARRIAVVLLMLAALGAAVTTMSVVLSADATFGAWLGERLGHAGGVSAQATRLPGLWLAVLLAALLVAASGWLAATSSAFGGLSDRYDRSRPADQTVEGAVSAPSPEEATPAVGSPASGVGARAAWDDLSDGRDPTESQT